MANYSQLKAAIADVIKTNGTKAITGQVLQDTLNSMVSVLGANYQFAGVATPSTNPGTPDQNVFYFATQVGVYTNFGGITLEKHALFIFYWNGVWNVNDSLGLDDIYEDYIQQFIELLEQYQPIVIEGDVVNAPDEEDLTSVNNLLKFKNKAYFPEYFSGLGRVFLRKNIVNGENVLTQEMISEANTIYILQYDYTIAGNITIPDGCVLFFNGGSMKGGGMSLNNSVVCLNGSTIEVSNPITMKNSKILGNGGTIKAASVFSHPDIVLSIENDVIEGVTIDANGTTATCLAVYDEQSTLTERYNTEVRNVTFKNTVAVQVATVSSIQNMVVTTTTNHGLSTGDRVEITDVVGGYGTGITVHSIYDGVWLVEVLSDTTFKIHYKSLSISNALDTNFTPATGGNVYKIGVGLDVGGKPTGESYRNLNVNKIYCENVYMGIVSRCQNDSYETLNISATKRAIDLLGCGGSTFHNIVTDNTIRLELTHEVIFDGIKGSLGLNSLFELLAFNSGGYAPGEVEGVFISNVDVIFSPYLVNPCIVACSRGLYINNVGIECSAHYDFIKVYGSIQNSKFSNIDCITGRCNLINCDDGKVLDINIGNVYYTQIHEGVVDGDVGTIILDVSRVNITSGSNCYISSTTFNISFVSAGTGDLGGITLRNILGIVDLQNVMGAVLVNCKNYINYTTKGMITILNGSFSNVFNTEHTFSGSYGFAVNKGLVLHYGDNAPIILGKFTTNENIWKKIGLKVFIQTEDNMCEGFVSIKLLRNGTIYVNGKFSKTDFDGTTSFPTMNVLFDGNTYAVPTDGTQVSETKQFDLSSDVKLDIDIASDGFAEVSVAGNINGFIGV